MGSFLFIWAAICSSTLAGHLVGQGGDDDVAVFQFIGGPHADDAGAAIDRWLQISDFGVMISAPDG
jgi:hypothetical protein